MVGIWQQHHSSWDDYASTDPWCSALHDRAEAHSRALLNNGFPTSATGCDQGAGICTPDVYLVNRFTWETIPKFSSDHLQLLFIWGEYIKVEHVHAGRRPSYPKVDWLLFRNCPNNIIHVVSSVRSLSNHLEAFCIFKEMSLAEVVPI